MNEPGTEREPFELLAEEFIERCRRGEHPSVEDYARRHPELAAEIHDLFPTILTIESAKDSSAADTPAGPIRGEVELARLGDFRIIRELGRGGMGIVYEAEQESLGRRVALKVLPRQALLDPVHLSRFEREARTAAKLHHTNIVPVFGVGQCEGYHYIVMQRIDGVGLDVVIRELLEPSADSKRTIRADGEPGTPVHLPLADELSMSAAGRWRAIARLILQTAEALAYAHGQGTLHRDIKPANLILDADGKVWVADFGLARLIDQAGATQPGDVVGTLRYMAPEQIQGRCDARSDIYALGLTLYELATLRPAYVESGRTSLIDAIMNGRPRAPRQLCPRIPRDLETVILKCIAPDPSSRYATATDLADDLRRYLEDRPILARRATAPERMWRWSRRNPAMAGLAGAALLLLVAVAVTSTAGYVRTRQANELTRQALGREQEQRRRAEATSELAVEALDTIFAEFAPQRTTSITATYSEGSESEVVSVPVQPVLSKETAALLEHMLEFYLRLAAQEGENPVIQRKIAEANQRVGDIHQRLGHFGAAEHAYGQALAMYGQLADAATDLPDLRVEMARAHNELGSLLTAQERGGEGRDEHLRAAALLQTDPTEADSSISSRLELARTLFLLGKTPRPAVPVPPPQGRREPGRPPYGAPRDARGRGDSPLEEKPPPFERANRERLSRRRPVDMRERDEYLDEAIRLLKELAEDRPEMPSIRRLLARCYGEYRTSRPGQAEPPSREPRIRAVQILEQLVADYPGVPEYRFDLAAAYVARDEPGLHPPPDPVEVERRMHQSLDILEELATERPNVPDYILSAAHVHHRLGGLLWRAGRFTEAEDSFRRAEDLQSSLARRFPEVAPYQVAQALYRMTLAEFLRDRQELAEARNLLESGLDTLQSDVCQALRQDYVSDMTRHCHRVLADVLRRAGEAELAEHHRRLAESDRDGGARR